MVTQLSPTVLILKRRGFEKSDIQALRKAYKAIYRQSLTVDEALVELEALKADSDSVNLLIESIQQSTRGIIR